MFSTIIDSLTNPPDTTAIVDSVDVYSLNAYDKRSSGISARYLKEKGALFVAGGVDWLSGSLRAANADTSVSTRIEDYNSQSTTVYTSRNYWTARQNQLDVWSNIGVDMSETFGERMPVRVDLSGRLQFVKNRTTQPSYNLGMVYAPFRFMKLKIGYGYAFRLPTLAEQFADDVFTAGNADSLSPETARTLQGTLSFVTDDKTFRAEATLFHQRIDSLIQYLQDATTFRYVPQNVERFRSTGIDMTLSLQAGSHLNWNWNLVVQNAEQSVDRGERMVDAYYVPDIKWRGDMNAVFNRFSANINLTYTSERSVTLWGGNQKVLPQVYELGMGLSVQVNRRVSLRLTGYDLFDQRRPDQLGFTMGDGDYPTLGRRFILETRLSLL
jgi:outer membrane receptor protein involved in Fe transport